MNYNDVQVIYRDVDREIAKAIFLEAVKNTQEDYR